MRNDPLGRLRAGRARALAEGTAAPVAFYWDDPTLTTAEDDSTFSIWFNDMIDDWYGISSAMIIEALIMADGRDVLVHLNSPGGMVTEGLAIHSAFKQYAGNVTMRVEGLAASAASFVMLAGNEVLIDENALVMVHDAWDITMGPAVEHRRTADLLDKISDNIAGMYAAKSGGDASAWRTTMTENGDLGTWYVGQEAVDAGLVDRVAGDVPAESEAAASARRDWGGLFASPKRTATTAAAYRGPIDKLHRAALALPIETESKEPETPTWWATLQSGLRGVQQ